MLNPRTGGSSYVVKREVEVYAARSLRELINKQHSTIRIRERSLFIGGGWCFEVNTVHMKFSPPLQSDQTGDKSEFIHKSTFLI